MTPHPLPPLNRRLPFLRAFLIICAALSAPLAVAQQDPIWPAATLDPLPAYEPLTSSAAQGGRSVTLNPASLGLLDAPDASYRYSGSAQQGDMHGLYAASPLFDGFGLGASTEWLEVPGEHLLLARRYRVGVGARLGRRLALGARYSWLGSERSADLDQWSSWDIGLHYRLLDELVFTALVERLDFPRFGDQWLKPRVHLGAGWRAPSGAFWIDGLYTLPIEDTQDIGQFQGVLGVEPVSGWRLYAQANGGDDPRAFSGVDEGFGWRAGGGMGFVFPGGVTLSGGALARLDDSGASFDGFSVALQAQAPGASAPLWTPAGRWVALEMPGDLPERAPRSPFGVTGPALLDWLQMLDALRLDPSVDGVVLHIDGLAFGFAQLQELHEAILAVRAQGKTVIAHMRDTSTRSYFLACAASRIYVEPGRVFSPRGIATTLTFYRTALNRLGVEPFFVKIDRYKSAPESFLLDGPSPESQEQLGAYLDGLSLATVQATIQARGLTDTKVRAAFDRVPMRPEDAIRDGLIDGITHRDALPEILEGALGLPYQPALERGYTPPTPTASPWRTAPRIAVVHIDGTIIDGTSIETPFAGTQATGAETIEQTLKALSEHPDVAAIVIRINSPGGSASGSEVIHRAIAKAAEKKPLVASLGDIAASGGYYAAVAAPEIFADPLTLTGSIGVFAGKFHITNLLSWLGISRYTLKRGQFADLYGPDSAWDEAAKARAQESIEFFYETFVDRVAAGRDITPSAVRKVGEGHVWIGTKALELQLVDHLGGLLAAIARAKVLAEIPLDAPVIFLNLPARSPLSAFEGAIPKLPSISFSTSPAEPAHQTQHTSPLQPLTDPLTAFLIDAGTLHVLTLIEEGKPLALLPFAWRLDD